MALALTQQRPKPYWSVTPEAVAQFQQDGFYIVPQLLQPEEAALLQRIARAEPNGQKQPDGSQPIMWLFADIDKQDIWNGIVHSRRIVDAMRAFLGDDVYVYHYKMAMKEVANSAPNEEGRENNWEWQCVASPRPCPWRCARYFAPYCS
jgi:hypothetical protein